MKQKQFEEQHQNEWKGLRLFLQTPPKQRRANAQRLRSFPHDYRRLTMQLAIARERNYSLNLIEELEELTLDCHQHLYGRRNDKRLDLMQFFLVTFPQSVRREWKLMLLSGFLLLGMMGLMIGAVQLYPELPHYLLDADTLSRIEEMYDPAGENFKENRDAYDDLMMWAHYIRNNVGIDFACFASGIFVGIGSIFFMLFNGIFLGVVAGHLTQIGYGSTFWPFVSGHGALELVAAVISGAAGMKVGFSILAPGPYTRVQALKRKTAEALPILAGAATMTFLAAFIEAFWSPLASIPPHIKYIYGGAMWCFVIFYFIFFGRGRRHVSK